MAYTLGVDLGGRGPAAAIGRPDGRGLPLAGGPSTPLADLADRLGTPHDRPGPVTAQHALADVVARWVATATTAHAARPDDVVISHPAAWGPYRTGLLADALGGRDLPPWRLVADTLAIARHATTTTPAGPAAGPSVLVVVDVREERTTVGVVDVPAAAGAAAPPGLRGPVEVLLDLAAADLDDAVLAHTLGVAGDPGPAGATSPTREAAERLRASCRAAADEVLIGGAAVVPFPSGDAVRPIRVTLADVEPRLRSRGGRAVTEMAAAVARLAPAGVDAVVLAGRLAPMPLLTELVAERFDAPVTVLPGGDEVPALGAATLAHLLSPQSAGETTGDGDGAEGAAGRAGGIGDDRGRRHGRRHAQVRRRAPGRPVRAAALAWIGALVLGVLAAAAADDAVARGGGAGPEPAGAVVTEDPRPGAPRG